MNINEIIAGIKDIADNVFLPNKEPESGKKIMVATSHSLQLGGAPLALLSLLQIMSKEYECIVIAPSDGEIRYKFIDAGIAVFTAPAHKFGCDAFKNIISQIDLYFCNTVVSGYYVSLAYGLETPTIWWIHEEHAFINSYIKDLYIKKCTSSNILAAAVSLKAQNAVNELLHLPCSILNLGIEDQYGKFDYENKCETVSFFMPANLLYSKGHDVIAKAITMMSKDYHAKCEFIFAGGYDDISDYPYQLMQVLSDNYDNVKYLGAIDRLEVFRRMASASCVLAPSRIDTLPTTVVEGMMMGKLCLVSDATGISQYITDGENGLIFKSENPEDLVQKLQYVIDNIDMLKRIGANSRQLYNAYFRADKCYDNVCELISIINSNIEERKDKRLVMVVGEIDILDIFSYRLKDYFTLQGYDVYIVNEKDIVNSLVGLITFMTKPVKAMITFNNSGMNLEMKEGENFWELWDVPCIDILMDHPFCFNDRMAAMNSKGIVLCVDRNHMNYLLRFYPEVSISGYLPHGGIELNNKKKLIEERNIDVLYVGGLSRNSAYKIMPDFTKYTDFDAEAFCKEVYEYLIKNIDVTLEDAIELLLNERGLYYEDDMLREIISDLHVIDLYVVSYYRELTVKTIAEAGINLELYGVGWEKCDWINLPNVKYGGRISADEAVEKMCDAKIVLNTMTWFKDGTHDRVFNGMLQKAVTISDESTYMREEFNGDYDINGNNSNCDMILFKLDEIDKLPQIVKHVLDNRNIAQKVAENGYLKAKSGHTWEKRGEELVKDLFSEF